MWLVAFVVIGLPSAIFLFWKVHLAVDRICVGHARRFCKKNGLEVQRERWQPAFNKSGIKTEFTLVQMDCHDVRNQRKLIQLAVWPFGVREVMRNENYPDFYDEEWPPGKQA